MKNFSRLEDDGYEEYKTRSHKYMEKFNERLFHKLDSIPVEKVEKKYEKSRFNHGKCIILDVSINEMMHGRGKRWFHWKFPKYFKIDMMDIEHLKVYFGFKFDGNIEFYTVDHWLSGQPHIWVVFVKN